MQYIYISPALAQFIHSIIHSFIVFALLFILNATTLNFQSRGMLKPVLPPIRPGSPQLGGQCRELLTPRSQERQDGPTLPNSPAVGSPTNQHSVPQAVSAAALAAKLEATCTVTDGEKTEKTAPLHLSAQERERLHIEMQDELTGALCARGLQQAQNGLRQAATVCMQLLSRAPSDPLIN